jgi:hypothetical protein
LSVEFPQLYPRSFEELSKGVCYCDEEEKEVGCRLTKREARKEREWMV